MKKIIAIFVIMFCLFSICSVYANNPQVIDKDTESKLVEIKEKDLIDIFKEDLTFRNTVGATEQKTKKYKEFAINDKLKEELIKYICCYFHILYDIRIGIDSINLNRLTDQEQEQVKEIVRTKPLFPSERTTEHISRYQVDRI